MSDVSSELGAAGRKRAVSELASRLHRKAASERLSLSAHLSIGRLLCKLRDAIVAREELGKQEAIKILLLTFVSPQFAAKLFPPKGGRTEFSRTLLHQVPNALLAGLKVIVA